MVQLSEIMKPIDERALSIKFWEDRKKELPPGKDKRDMESILKRKIHNRKVKRERLI